MKGGFGFLHDFQNAVAGHSERTADTDIAIESITLDFLKGSLKDGNVEIRKERVFDFFKSHQDVCKPSPRFRKKFPLQQKSGGGGYGVPLQQDVFATFSPFHLAVIFMKELDEKMKLMGILKQRMIQDKDFARDALFTEVDNQDLFNKVSKTNILQSYHIHI